MKPNWFVALPVPAAAWLPALTANTPPGCRTFQAEDVHMTLSFLGPAPADRITRLIDLVEAVRAQPLEITCDKLLLLPGPRRFSALSLSLASGLDAAAAMIGDYRDRFTDAVDAPRDTRPPLPHITVARPVRKATQAERAGIAQWARSVTPPRQTLVLDRIALYTWALDRRRRQFRIVFERPLTTSH